MKTLTDTRTQTQNQHTVQSSHAISNTPATRGLRQGTLLQRHRPVSLIGNIDTGRSQTPATLTWSPTGDASPTTHASLTHRQH